MSDINDPTPEQPFIAFVWRAEDGSITHRRRFKTLWGAVRFCRERSSASGIREVSLIQWDDKQRNRRTVWQKGDLTPPPEHKGSPPASALRAIEDFQHMHTQLNTNTGDTMTDKTNTDEGTEVKKEQPKRTSTRAATPKPAIKRTAAMSWEDVLAMSDSKIMKVEQGKRPNPKTLDGLKHADDAYTKCYVNFLTGERKHPVQAFMHKIPAEDGMARRNALRKVIAKHVNVKPASVRLEEPRATKPKAKIAPKPAAKKPAAKAPSKPAAKKPSKPATVKAAAASKRGRSITVKTKGRKAA